MINIHSRLGALSATGGAGEERGTFCFRRPRSHPGAGLYRQLDDARLVLQVQQRLK
jgi:hypothetical protein